MGMPSSAGRRLTPAERAAAGKSARAVAPLEAHAEFRPAISRDPVGLLLGQAATRDPELVPIRHGRMLVSPFTFYRGAALVMAADLATTPTPGLRAQLCGDAHLSNFGAFASPERRLVFDINDFDETLPGPFEWDVKRLAASFVVAGRDNGFTDEAASRKIALAAVESYRTAMRDFAAQPILDVWYAHLDIEEAAGRLKVDARPNESKKQKADRGRRGAVAKAHTRDSLQAIEQADHDGRRPAGGSQRPAADRPVDDLSDWVDREPARSQIREPAGRVPRHPPGRSAAPARSLHARRRRAQGGRRGQRRYPGLDRAARGRRRGEALLLQAKQAAGHPSRPTTRADASTTTRGSGLSPVSS